MIILFLATNVITSRIRNLVKKKKKKRQVHFNLSRSILAFGSEKSRWMSRHSHEVFFVTCLPVRKFLFQKGNASLRFPPAYFFLPRPFSRFTLARHRKLSTLVKGRRLARRRLAKGIFRACLLLLHPL